MVCGVSTSSKEQYTNTSQTITVLHNGKGAHGEARIEYVPCVLCCQLYLCALTSFKQSCCNSWLESLEQRRSLNRYLAQAGRSQWPLLAQSISPNCATKRSYNDVHIQLEPGIWKRQSTICARGVSALGAACNAAEWCELHHMLVHDACGSPTVASRSPTHTPGSQSGWNSHQTSFGKCACKWKAQTHHRFNFRFGLHGHSTSWAYRRRKGMWAEKDILLFQRHRIVSFTHGARDCETYEVIANFLTTTDKVWEDLCQARSADVRQWKGWSYSSRWEWLAFFRHPEGELEAPAGEL